MYMILGLLYPIIVLGGIGALIYFLFKKTEVLKNHEPIETPKYLGWILGLTVISFNIFAYQVEPGIGLGIFYSSLCLGLLMAFEKRSPFLYFLGLLGASAGLLLAFRANEVLMQINMIVANFSALLLIVLYTFQHVEWTGLWWIKAAGTYIVRAFKHVFGIFASAKNEKNKSKRILFETFKISALTLIVLAIFANILSAADPIFNELIKDVKEEFLDRALLSLVLVFVLFFVLSLRIRGMSKEESKLKLFGFYDLAVPSGALVLLLGFFLFVQAKYLFGNHASVEAFDLTYSEYVRKGFIELLTAAALGGSISYLLILKGKALEIVQRVRGLQFINVLLILELALLLASAFQRDIIYVEAYGYTRLRIIGFAFLVWLALVLVQLFVFNLFQKWKEAHLFRGIFTISVVAFVVLNALNVDKMIVEANLARPEKTDTYYNALLSTDAHETWLALIESSYDRYQALYQKRHLTEEELHDLADAQFTLQALVVEMEKLKKMHQSIDKDPKNNYEYKRIKQTQKWQSKNWSEQQADAALTQDQVTYYDLPICILQEMEQWKQYNDLPNIDLDLTSRLNEAINIIARNESPLVKIEINFPRNFYENLRYTDTLQNGKQVRIYETPRSCASPLVNFGT